MIVTFNLRDFPKAYLARFGIEAMHPDEFVENLIDLDTAAVVAAAQAHRASLKNPILDVDRYLDNLHRQELVQTTKALAAFRAVL